MQPPRPFRFILAAIFVAVCVTAQGQIVKSLGFNTTNGQVIANTGTNALTFTNSTTIDANGGAMRFSVTADEIAVYSGAAGENILTLPEDGVPVFSQNYYWNDPSVRASLGFSTSLSTLWTATNAAAARSAVGLNTNNSVQFVDVIGDSFEAGAGSNFSRITPDGLEFGHAALAAASRTNLSLGLPALTNTSNVTMMRALAGSTNTNAPFSGTINSEESNLIAISNGIIISVTPY